MRKLWALIAMIMLIPILLGGIVMSFFWVSVMIISSLFWIPVQLAKGKSILLSKDLLCPMLPPIFDEYKELYMSLRGGV